MVLRVCGELPTLKHAVLRVSGELPTLKVAWVTRMWSVIDAENHGVKGLWCVTNAST